MLEHDWTWDETTARNARAGRYLADHAERDAYRARVRAERMACALAVFAALVCAAGLAAIVSP